MSSYPLPPYATNEVKRNFPPHSNNALNAGTGGASGPWPPPHAHKQVPGPGPGSGGQFLGGNSAQPPPLAPNLAGYTVVLIPNGPQGGEGPASGIHHQQAAYATSASGDPFSPAAKRQRMMQQQHPQQNHHAPMSHPANYQHLHHQSVPHHAHHSHQHLRTLPVVPHQQQLHIHQQQHPQMQHPHLHHGASHLRAFASPPRPAPVSAPHPHLLNQFSGSGSFEERDASEEHQAKQSRKHQHLQIKKSYSTTSREGETSSPTSHLYQESGQSLTVVGLPYYHLGVEPTGEQDTPGPSYQELDEGSPKQEQSAKISQEVEKHGLQQENGALELTVKRKYLRKQSPATEGRERTREPPPKATSKAALPQPKKVKKANPPESTDKNIRIQVGGKPYQTAAKATYNLLRLEKTKEEKKQALKVIKQKTKENSEDMFSLVKSEMDPSAPLEDKTRKEASEEDSKQGHAKARKYPPASEKKKLLEKKAIAMGLSCAKSKASVVAEAAASATAAAAAAGGNNYDEAWHARLEELKQYKANYGNCLVPKKSQTHPELGIWVMNQRAQYKLLQEDRTYTNSAGNSKPSTMTPERIRALEEVGFVWSMCDHVDWDDRLEELREYKRRHGDCLVPNKYPPNPQLGTWVNKQRTQYKLLCDGKSSSMTKERVEALKALGFVWSKRDLVDWSQRLDELKQYKAKTGDCLVPNKYAPNPQLGIWAMHQRAQYRKLKEGKPSPMTEERIKALEETGFVWAISNADIDWGKRIADLRAYRANFGNCLVPNKYPENPKLGAWVGKQRKQYKLMQEGKPSTMNVERVNILEGMGFVWSLRSLVDWNARWLELRRYKRLHGNCLVPQQYPENPQLGTWVSNQRKQYRLMQENKPSPMTMERVRKLESLGFVWSKFTHDSHWEAKMDELREYKIKYGDCNVPEEYHVNPNLGTWVHYQRTQYAMMIEGRPSNMTPERVEALDTLGFDWDLARFSRNPYLAQNPAPATYHHQQARAVGTPQSASYSQHLLPPHQHSIGYSLKRHAGPPLPSGPTFLPPARHLPMALPSLSPPVQQQTSMMRASASHRTGSSKPSSVVKQEASSSWQDADRLVRPGNDAIEEKRLGGLGALILALEADTSSN